MKTIDDFAYDVRDKLSRQRLGYISYYAIIAIIRILFDEIEKSIESGEEVNIPNFGKFKRKLRAARTGRDMTTGLMIPIPERYMPVFEPAKHLKEKISGKNKK